SSKSKTFKLIKKAPHSLLDRDEWLFRYQALIYAISVMNSSFGRLTFLSLNNQSFDSSRYPKGRIVTLFKPFSGKPKRVSNASLSKPSIGVASTFSSAAAAIAVPKEI